MIGEFFRQSCTDCDSSSLTWRTAADLVELVAADDRGRISMMAEFLGPEATGWLCGDCKAFGLFGGMVFEQA